MWIADADLRRSSMTTAVTEDFTQTDPRKGAVGSSYGQAYAYAMNNPAVYLDPSGLAATVGENLVSRQRQMIVSTASKYGLLPELPAAILLGENDFNRFGSKVSDLFEDYTPSAIQGDPRRGPANLGKQHSLLQRQARLPLPVAAVLL